MKFLFALLLISLSSVPAKAQTVTLTNCMAVMGSQLGNPDPVLVYYRCDISISGGLWPTIADGVQVISNSPMVNGTGLPGNGRLSIDPSSGIIETPYFGTGIPPVSGNQTQQETFSITIN